MEQKEKNFNLQANVLQIPWKNLTVGQLLGHGGYGDVYQGNWQGTQVAIKQLYLKTLSEHLLDDFVHETKVMAQCNFPRIVRLYGVCMETGHYSIVMEYMPKGPLYQVLQNKGNELPWPQRFEIAIDIGKGLSFLHSQNILHRDLKSLNILLDEHYHAKISDFGLAKIKLESSGTSTKNTRIGTVRWRTPESFKRGFKPVFSTDIYSYGMVLWEIATRTLPYADAQDETTVGIWIKDGEKENIPTDCPLEYSQVIQKTWELPENRPTASEVTLELEKVKPKPLPQPKSPTEKPYAPKPWHFDLKTKQAAMLPKGQDYTLLPATQLDIEKVIGFYQHHPVAGYGISKVEVIYNPGFNRSFELHLQKLQRRHNNPAFVAKWSAMADADLRQEAYDQFMRLASPYTDPDYPNVKLLPAWHGTKPQVLDSLFSAGYANLAITDKGFFGGGYYSAYEAEYSYRVYSKGALILNWVASYSPLPVVNEDMQKLELEGKSNYGNYDAHFVPIKPRFPNNPDETVYYPCQALDEQQYTEMVVFDSAALLPRYLVELQAELVNPIPITPMPIEQNTSAILSNPETPPDNFQQEAIQTLSPPALSPSTITVAFGKPIALSRTVPALVELPKLLETEVLQEQLPKSEKRIPLAKLSTESILNMQQQEWDKNEELPEEIKLSELVRRRQAAYERLPVTTPKLPAELTLPPASQQLKASQESTREIKEESWRNIASTKERDTAELTLGLLKSPESHNVVPLKSATPVLEKTILLKEKSKKTECVRTSAKIAGPAKTCTPAKSTTASGKGPSKKTKELAKTEQSEQQSYTPNPETPTKMLKKDNSSRPSWKEVPASSSSELEEKSSYVHPVFHQPQASVKQNTLSYAEQVEQMSHTAKERNKIRPQEVQALLKWVTEGHLVEVEKLLKKNPSLGICTRTVIDLSDRTFKNMTALQYAAWCLDQEMCDLIMGYVGTHNSAIQLKALYAEPGRYSPYGDHYDIKPLIIKTQTYRENYSKWNDDQRQQYWQKEVGGEQRKCPAWLIYAWSEEGEDVAWTKQDFSRKIKREYDKNRLDWWFTENYNNGRGVGSTWAGVRGLSRYPAGVVTILVTSRMTIDVGIQEKLDKLSDERLAKLKSLSESVKPATFQLEVPQTETPQVQVQTGGAEAQNNLGFCYENGDGVEQDFKQAVYYYRLSAEQGDMWAQNKLGVCYQNGRGVEKDFKIAVHYYRLAAQQGDAWGQNNLGFCYENGYGVEKDFKQAMHYYRLAADQGHADAQYNLNTLGQFGSPYSPTLFQPAPRKVLSAPEQVEQISTVTKKQNQIPQEEVHVLLKWVIEGDLVEVEKLLKKIPSLGVCTGTVKDRSDRMFKNITALQYAAWALDREMCDLLMGYLGTHNSAIQLKAWYADPDRYSKYGDYYNMEALISKTHTYERNYDYWSEEQSRQCWEKEVSEEQKKCPAWLVYAWSEEGKDVAWTKQDFTRKIKREGNKHSLNWWFSRREGESAARGVAASIEWCITPRKQCERRWFLNERIAKDRYAMERLYTRGKQLLTELKSLSYEVDYTAQITTAVKSSAVKPRPPI